ncbi:hypothetical protein [Streptomyces thermodiastaticus]|uniref:hypothetical protein n=1 Tax=Streptomyces thermodiastaticus TaxID=44061 RepID=UPI00167A59C6|nr:hypothetical protein [Streptomyces thermodiastaticus]MCE7551855.1 hypothetical protein [Streptomyces thermodiastaticus]GHF79727.1 hypothetical protein GCM10018787_30650 [Streptomyces thermodiastaticus]
MGNPVVLVLQAALLSVTVAGYSLAVTLPRMLAAGARWVWRVFGAAPAARAPGGEPARPVYAVVTAPRDLASAWREALAEQSRLLEEPERFLVDRLRRVDGAAGRRDGLGLARVLLYPALVASLVVVILVTAALCLVPVLSALLVWGLGCAVWVPWWALWAAVARVEQALRRQPAPCPYPDCGRTIRRPVVLCPACGARHRRLLPGRYGALVHRCRCGARLPAVGRPRHRTVCCPYCSRTVPAGYDRARVVVLAGGADGVREAVHRRVLSALGAPGDAQPPVVRGTNRPLLFFAPPHDAYDSQEAVGRLDVLRHADGLLLVVGDPAVHHADVRAVHRVLNALAALPARRRPRRAALLYPPAPPGDDSAVRRRIARDGGGHLLRAVEASGARVRCAGGADDAADLAGTVRWLAGADGVPAPDGHLSAPVPAREPARPAGWRHRLGRRVLLSVQAGGVLVLPMLLVLLEARLLPPHALFGAAGAYDAWRRPLTGTVHRVDILATTTRDWPRLTASHAAAGHPPSSVLPGHDGYWSVKGTPGPDNWLRIDLGLPLPLTEVSYDFVPASVRTPQGSLMRSPGLLTAQRGSLVYHLPGSPKERIRRVGNGLFGEAYGWDIPIPDSAGPIDALRIGLGGLVTDTAYEEQLQLREVHIRWTTSDALRLHPEDGGRLRIENTTGRDLALHVQPLTLPEGVRATLVERPPRVLPARSSTVIRWRLTGVPSTGRVPVAYAVGASEDGHTVTARCLALVDEAGRTRSLC